MSPMPWRGAVMVAVLSLCGCAGATLVALCFRAFESRGPTVALGLGACVAAVSAVVSTFRHHRQVDVQVVP